MPAIHTASFRVRHYECDAYGHLNNANYIRYMEEEAFEASASVEYPKARYEELGHLWLARETRITYLQPVKYGDTVEVKTWVGDFRRVHSQRQYEFRKADQLVATASTDWVYLDVKTLKPSVISSDMIQAFMPEGLTETAPPRQRFPDLPPPPAGIFKLRRRVEWRDIDTARHVNNAVYFNYIEDCGMQVAVARGWPLTRAESEGFGVIAREHHIEYRNQALLDDELEIATWATPRSRATAARFYAITRPRDNLLMTQAVTLWVWVDLQTGRPIRIPAQYLADFAVNMVER